MVGWLTYSRDMSLGKLRERVKGRVALRAAVHGVTKSDLVTEQQQQLIVKSNLL